MGVFCVNLLYFKKLEVDRPEAILNKFYHTLIDTNRGYNFFVDWDKVKRHVEEYKIEFNILNTLIGSENFDTDLKKHFDGISSGSPGNSNFVGDKRPEIRSC